MAGLKQTSSGVALLPSVGNSFINVGPLSPFSLPGIPPNRQVEYPSQDLEIYPDGSYNFEGLVPTNLNVEVTTGDGTWNVVPVTVFPNLDLELPNFQDQVVSAGTSLSLDLDNVYGSGLGDPRVVSLINSTNLTLPPYNFPAGSVMDDTTGVITVDTSVVGVYNVRIAVQQGTAIVTDDIVIEVTSAAQEVADFSYSWAIDARALADFSYSWAIDSRAVADFSYAWAIDSRTVSDFSYSWAINSRESTTVSYSWAIDARAISANSYSWGVGQTQTVANYGYSWLLDGRESADFLANWQISSARQTVGFSTSWLIVGTQFANDRGFSWGIGTARAEVNFSANWLIRGFASVDYPASWRLLAKPTFGVDRAFHILN